MKNPKLVKFWELQHMNDGKRKLPTFFKIVVQKWGTTKLQKLPTIAVLPPTVTRANKF